MKLDFEKFLNENGLKVGDKVKIACGVTCKIHKEENIVYLANEYKQFERYSIANLQNDFEIIESKKKVGELTCNKYGGIYGCKNCIFNKLGLDCDSYREDVHFNALKEGLLKDHPLLEPLRPVIEKELDKEVEEDE